MTPARGWLREHSRSLGVIFRLTDAIIVAGSLLVACEFRKANEVHLPWFYVLGLLAMGLFILIGEFCDLYRPWRGRSRKREILEVLRAWATVVTLLLVAGYLSKQSHIYSRTIISIWMLLTPCVLLGWRILLRSGLQRMRAHGHNTRTALVMGTGEIANMVANVLTQQSSHGFRFLGFFNETGAEPQRKGTIKDAISLAHEGGVDHIFLAIPLAERDKIERLISDLSDTTVDLSLVPDLLMVDLVMARWGDIGGITTISVFNTPFYGADGALKRIEDLVLSLFSLLVWAVPMLIIGLLIKLASPGPIIFRQRRYGIGGREITVLKFRTMTVCEDGDTIQQATADDQRVTPIGRILRRWSLDELPQFFNVLKGDMSLVGPRPHAIAHNEEYRQLVPGYMLRHKVKPGITGWAQINGWRGETDTLEKMEKRVEFDLDYIRNWSLSFDIKILLLTFLRWPKLINAH